MLPWCPFVENGTRKDCPTEDLEMDGGRCRTRNTFEEAVNVIVDNVFEAWVRREELDAGTVHLRGRYLSKVLCTKRRPICIRVPGFCCKLLTKWNSTNGVGLAFKCVLRL